MKIILVLIGMGQEGTSPLDAPLITVNEVARYVGRSPEAVRQTMKRAKKGQDDYLGRALLEIQVHIGPRRIMFRKPDLLEWLKVQS